MQSSGCGRAAVRHTTGQLRYSSITFVCLDGGRDRVLPSRRRLLTGVDLVHRLRVAFVLIHFA